MTFNNQVKYGEEAWDNVRKMANIDTPTFSIHQVKIRSWLCPDVEYGVQKLATKYDD